MAEQTGIAQTGPQQVARTQRTVKELLESPEFRSQVRAALPSHMKPERFVRVALNATMRNPELLECTRESLFRCLLDLSVYGLEADGRNAYLIPFRNQGKLECTLILSYMGLVSLVRRSGDISFIHADVVYENDIWDYSYGTGAFLKHKPNLEDRGSKVRAIYSFVKLKDGGEDFIVLGKSEIEKVRAKSKAPNSPAWRDHWDEMAKKTAFRRHSKWLPLSSEVREAAEQDDAINGGDAIDASVDRLEQIAESAGGGLRGRLAAAISEQEPERFPEPEPERRPEPQPEPSQPKEQQQFIPDVAELPDPAGCTEGQQVYYGKYRFIIREGRWKDIGENPNWKAGNGGAKKGFF